MLYCSFRNIDWSFWVVAIIKALLYASSLALTLPNLVGIADGQEVGADTYLVVHLLC